MIIRPSTREDVIEMCGGTFPDNIWGITAEEDGEVVGIAGIHYTNPRMCFSNIKQSLKKSPRTIVRMAHAVREVMGKSEVPVYAIADKNEPTAPKFLEHVGFEHLMTSSDGEIYRWHQ